MQKKVVQIKNQQKRPFFIPDSEPAAALWAVNYDKNLSGVAEKYGVPDALRAEVAANTVVLAVVFKYLDEIMKWLTKWREAKDALFVYAPSSKSPVDLPSTPAFDKLPATVGPYILTPHIQSANIILANPALTDTDRQLLGLVKAEPSKRLPHTAEDFNYPLLSIKQQNGAVSIRIKRGERFRGRDVLIQADKTGTGEFTNLIIFGGNATSDPINLPKGVLTAAWSYRAVYLNGTATISDWSPIHDIAVKAGIQPFMNPAPPPSSDEGEAKAA
jgi:hypothetical protein